MNQTKFLFKNRKKELEKIIRQTTTKLSYTHTKDYIETWNPSIWNPNSKDICFTYSSFNHAKPNLERAWIKGKLTKNNGEYNMEIDTFSPDKNEELFHAVNEIVKKTNTQQVKVTTKHVNQEYKQRLEEIPYKK